MEYKMCNIKGFENLYKIYEDGSIWSERKHRFLKQYPNGITYRYMYVCLVGHDRQQLRTGVHRIVAQHFIDSPSDGKTEINHKDLNSVNNHWTNLEWVTHRENILHARSLKEWKPGRKPGFKHSEEIKRKMAEKKMKKVALISDNEMIKFNSIDQLCKETDMYYKKFYRLVNSHNTWNGFKIRYLKD